MIVVTSNTPANSQQISDAVSAALGDKLKSITIAFDEVTATVKAADYAAAATLLRDSTSCKFEQLIDLCGIDFSEYADSTWSGKRYAVVLHLLSVSLNQRVRLRVFAEDDEFPILPTLVDIWPVANWYEREAFDLLGIMFEHHPDLRRILTDYGFVGHPFRKDFPMIGNVEMRYDPEQQRVIYQPVTIEMRNNVPRIIRDEGVHK